MRLFLFLLFFCVSSSHECPFSVNVNEISDIHVVCADVRASFAKLFTHEAKIEVKCESTGFDVSRSSEMYTFTDLIETLVFRDGRSSVEDAARSQAEY